MATYPTDFSKWETDMVRRALGRELNFLTLEKDTFAISKTYLLDVEQDLIDVTMRIRALKHIIGALIGVTF